MPIFGRSGLTLQVFGPIITWEVGRGIQANIGMDPIVGLEVDYRLSRSLIFFIHMKNLVVVPQVWKVGSGGHSRWVSAQDLQPVGSLGEEWSRYQMGLKHLGIKAIKVAFKYPTTFLVILDSSTTTNILEPAI